MEKSVCQYSRDGLITLKHFSVCKQGMTGCIYFKMAPVIIKSNYKGLLSIIPYAHAVNSASADNFYLFIRKKGDTLVNVCTRGGGTGNNPGSHLSFKIDYYEFF